MTISISTLLLWTVASLLWRDSLSSSLSQNTIAKFKRENLLKNTTRIQFQELHSTIRYGNVEYSLDDLEQFSVISTKNNHANVSKHLNSPLWRKQVNGTLLVVIKDDEGKIDHVSVVRDDDRVDYVTVKGDDGQQLFATISLSDYDDEKINTLTWNHKDAFKYVDGEDNDYAKAVISLLAPQKSDHCTSFKIIDVAIAYDTTLCKIFSFSKDQTDRHVQAIVGLASQFYEPMCLKLEISFIEGYCDESVDPFKDIVRSKSALERFTMLWRSHRVSVDRSVAHLLTGSNFEPGVLGYAFKATMCTIENAFGINYITWSDNIALRAALFAHELGHNAGADHFGSECSNWLMAPCGNGLGGFADASKQSVMNFVDKQRCLSSEAVIPPTFEFDQPNHNGFGNDIGSDFNNFNPNFNSNQNFYNNFRNPPYIPPQGPGHMNNPFFHEENFDVPQQHDQTNNNSQTNTSFRISNRSAENKCLTLRIMSSNDPSINIEKKVDLKSCQTNFSPKQGWKINTDTSYIHSAHDETQCLVPKFEAIESVATNQRKKRRIRLTVETCPYFKEKKFQWRVTNNGLIVNMKKDSDGTPLILQVSRGFRSSTTRNSQTILYIPTLSRLSSNINEFHRWSVRPV